MAAVERHDFLTGALLTGAPPDEASRPPVTLGRRQVGIGTQGRKHVPGLREGATETAAAAGRRTGTLLFVFDGAPGLRRAITGSPVQRYGTKPFGAGAAVG